MFKILGVDHIGIAVADLKETGSFWTEALGLECTGEEVVAEQKVKTSFNPTPNGSEIELLEATADDSPIAKFIAKNNGRGGIQHIALRVDDIEAAIAYNKAIDILHSKGVTSNFTPNYVEAITPRRYAEIYSTLDIAPGILNYEPISPNNQ